MNSKVVFADENVRESYFRLSEARSEEKALYHWLNKAFDELAENAFCGIQVPKRLIPEEYIRKYGIDNLWKYNLPGAWRLLYSVARDEVMVISIILEWLPHKKYERRLRY